MSSADPGAVSKTTTDLPVAMAEKCLRIVSANGDEQKVSVLDTTTVREILQQFEEDDVQDRQGSLLRGVTLLEPDMTVKEAGLEDGEDISILWSAPCIELTEWTGLEMLMGKDLYVRIPNQTTSIVSWAFFRWSHMVKLVIPKFCDTHWSQCLCCLQLTDTSRNLQFFNPNRKCMLLWLQFPDASRNPQLCDQHWWICLS